MGAKPDKVLSLLGLATKAGKAKSGALAVEEAIKSGKAQLLILAAEASEGTSKQFTNMSSYRNVSCITYGTKDSLGRAVGKEERSAVCILDEGLAEAIKREQARMLVEVDR